MPTYAYRCSLCSHEFDVVQKFADAPISICPECGGSVRRVFQPVGVVFKGSGWYINDSRSKTFNSDKTAKKADDKSDSDKPGPDKPSSDKGAADKGSSEKAAPVAASDSTASKPAKPAAD